MSREGKGGSKRSFTGFKFVIRLEGESIYVRKKLTWLGKQIDRTISEPCAPSSWTARSEVMHHLDPDR